MSELEVRLGDKLREAREKVYRLVVEREQYRQVVKGLQQDWAEAQEEVDRLREAIKEWSKLAKLHHAVMTERERDDCYQAAMYLHQIAREGR